MKIGFVIPWYGKEISGGAEFECRATALRLRAAGYDVEILTTCVKDFRSDWNQDYYNPGIEILEDLPVRRFRVRKTGRDEFHRINRKLCNQIPITLKDEKNFLKEMIRSDGLVQYMKMNEEKYLYILIPYMFGTTYDGAMACPDRSVLLPCLHDESYAYISLFKEMFRKVRGVIYNAPSEQTLAESLYDLAEGKGALIGMGMDLDHKGDGDRFRRKYDALYGIDQYILYAGRKDEGKNIQLLIDYFSAYKKNLGGNLKLVLIGGGEIDILPEHDGKDIIDLGYVSGEDKWDGYAGALALCNPSLNESFSIVMMEAWIAGSPTLVHERCHVTRDHCNLSRGGLYFSTFEDFVGCLDYLQDHPKIRQKMAKNGSQYVRENFSWPHVVKKYAAAFKKWGIEI